MGKKLIIKGADFSANAVPSSVVDITSLFTWESGTYFSDGSTKNSSSFIRSNTIDVSDYQGKDMVITWCAYNNSSGEAPSFYGLIFYNSSNQIIGYEKVQYAGEGVISSGNTVADYTVPIPSNAVGFKTTYFSESVSFEIEPFECKIINE